MASSDYGGRLPLTIELWHVYILACKDGTYYVGRTSNIDQRLVRHRRGEVNYTQSRLPVELIALLSFPNEWKAIQMEKYLKSGSGRAFAKRHLICIQE